MLVLTSQKKRKKEVLVLVITKPKQRLNDGQNVAQCVLKFNCLTRPQGSFRLYNFTPSYVRSIGHIFCIFRVLLDAVFLPHMFPDPSYAAMHGYYS